MRNPLISLCAAVSVAACIGLLVCLWRVDKHLKSLQGKVNEGLDSISRVLEKWEVPNNGQ